MKKLKFKHQTISELTLSSAYKFLCCHNARRSAVRLPHPQPLLPVWSRGFHNPISFNHRGEDMHSAPATGATDGIAGAVVRYGELASNTWVTRVVYGWLLLGLVGEPLSVHRSSWAELAPWSTNQFGEEEKINAGFPTWSQGGNIFLLVVIICCLCEMDAIRKREGYLCHGALLLLCCDIWDTVEIFFCICRESLNQIPGRDGSFLRLMITASGLCDHVRKIFEHRRWPA